MESIYLTIPLFFIVLLVIPILIQIDFETDINNKNLTINLCVFKLKVLRVKLLYKNNKILLYINKKQQDLNLELSAKQVYFIDQFFSNIKDKLQVKLVQINAEIGIKDNAYGTAMYCGTLNSIIKIMFAYLKTKKFTATLTSNIIPKYNYDKFIIKSKISVKISINELLYSVVISLLSVRRRIYERDKKQS